MTAEREEDPAATILQEYATLLDSLAAEVNRLESHLAGQLKCRPGCASCCIAFSVLPIEAENLRQAIKRLPRETKEKIAAHAASAPESCPLLCDHLCAAYDARPIICRTHGLPLAYLNEEMQAFEVSACPLNFGDDFEFCQEDLLFMDRFNAELSELNLRYCRSCGLDAAERIPIAGVISRTGQEAAPERQP